MNYLKNNCSIALMIDQRVSEGEKIELFGKPAYNYIACITCNQI